MQIYTLIISNILTAFHKLFVIPSVVTKGMCYIYESILNGF